MKITDELVRVINEDIERCEKEYTSGSKESRSLLYHSIVSKYSNVIDGIRDGLFSMNYDENGDKLRKNIKILGEHLVLFRAMGYENNAEKEPGVVVNNTINNSVDLSFESAKEKIEEMGALSQDEVDEILSKLSELEEIISSNDRRNQNGIERRVLLNG